MVGAQSGGTVHLLNGHAYFGAPSSRLYPPSHANTETALDHSVALYSINSACARQGTDGSGRGGNDYNRIYLGFDDLAKCVMRNFTQANPTNDPSYNRWVKSDDLAGSHAPSTQREMIVWYKAITDPESNGPPFHHWHQDSETTGSDRCTKSTRDHRFDRISFCSECCELSLSVLSVARRTRRLDERPCCEQEEWASTKRIGTSTKTIAPREKSRATLQVTNLGRRHVDARWKPKLCSQRCRVRTPRGCKDLSFEVRDLNGLPKDSTRGDRPRRGSTAAHA